MIGAFEAYVYAFNFFSNTVLILPQTRNELVDRL